MIATTTLTMIDGVRIVVPDSLDLITPYVLLEQQDWFEDEIKFLRRLLQPGQKVIDVGANYGVYTLSMAQTVGPMGCVWAFEPASNTARLLAEGIASNGFTQIVLERCALSKTCGTAQLSLNDNSELNALLHDSQSVGATETVPLLTLDVCMEKFGWQDIAFIKIDAEGEEANILQGGKKFFEELSPLVQYEIKAGTALHMELVHYFAALGYESYRLVPGLDLLVPFNTESPADGYLLNLFCCTQDRAEQLVTRGLLLDSADYLTAIGAERFNDISKKVKNSNAYHWRHRIAKLPYGAQLATVWEKTTAENRVAVEQALSLYAISQDSSLPSVERFNALEASFNLLKTLCERQPAYLRLASLARVARDYGARAIAVNALAQLSKAIFQQNKVDLSEPFLAPTERFDSIPPGKNIGDWMLASTLEAHELLGSFSSFYTGSKAQERLEIIHALGFGSAEMDRRLHLVQQRFGRLSS